MGRKGVERWVVGVVSCRDGMCIVPMLRLACSQDVLPDVLLHVALDFLYSPKRSIPSRST